MYDVTNYASANVSVSGGEITDGSALPSGNHSYTWQARNVSGCDIYTITFVATSVGTLPSATVAGNTITIYGNTDKNGPGGKK